MNLDRHIWEGWTPKHFIEELEWKFDNCTSFKTRAEVKKWCTDNQPYYKKYIPEVVKYFWEKNQKS